MAVKRPQFGDVLETSLYVEDTGRSARFYQSVFGFEPMVADDRIAALSVHGRRVLLLFKRGASVEDVETPNGVIPGHDGHGSLHLTFSVPAGELDAWERWLAENGVEVEHRMRWDRGGRSLYFRDPDGHLLEVATPGLWPIF